MIIKDLFFKIMYKPREIEFTAKSGRKYVVSYHREQFWTYEDKTLRNFFKSKFSWWHGQVWEVFKNGGRCGFGTYCVNGVFPKRRMKKFLEAEVNRLEKIFNKDGEHNE